MIFFLNYMIFRLEKPHFLKPLIMKQNYDLKRYLDIERKKVTQNNDIINIL